MNKGDLDSSAAKNPHRSFFFSATVFPATAAVENAVEKKKDPINH